ncbi:Methyltransferase-like protein 2 [Glycine soja]|nr:Methyltransferase-like protein 2 [Glycine soja]
MDPVNVLNRSYLRVTVSPSSYYSRFFKSSSTTPNSVTTVTSPLTTQKRKEPRALVDTLCNAAVLPAFNNLVANDTKDDAVAEILNNRYIMPQESCFYVSDLGQIRNLIPGNGCT